MSCPTCNDEVCSCPEPSWSTREHSGWVHDDEDYVPPLTLEPVVLVPDEPEQLPGAEWQP